MVIGGNWWCWKKKNWSVTVIHMGNVRLFFSHDFSGKTIDGSIDFSNGMGSAKKRKSASVDVAWEWLNRHGSRLGTDIKLRYTASLLRTSPSLNKVLSLELGVPFYRRWILNDIIWYWSPGLGSDVTQNQRVPTLLVVEQTPNIPQVQWMGISGQPV